jgi:hypothetical protein
LAIARNELIIVPDVSRQTLSNILRGRIEDITGWALLQENKSTEAVTRLKRAISILPEKSAWWRSSMWRLGSAQEAVGNSKDALESYIKSYTNGDADIIKYGVIESIYQKINGNTDGLEAKIGVKPASIVSSYPIQNATQKTEPTAVIQPMPEVKTQTAPTQAAPQNSLPIAETKMPPQNPAQETPTKAETVPEIKKEIAMPNEIKSETKESVNNQPAETKSKPLFEPIIINVPKVEPLKKPSPETKSEERPNEPKSAENNQKPSDEKTETRSRVVKENVAGQVSQCKILLNEETISISKNGGTANFPVEIEGEGDVRKIKAISISPKDLEVTLEPEIDNQTNRASFILKSISRRTGVFMVTFESNCGTKEIFIEVR